MGDEHDDLLQLKFQVGHLVSYLESEKETRLRVNRDNDMRYGRLEEQVNALRIALSGQKVSLGAIERIGWIVVAAVVGFLAKGMH